MVKKKYDSDFDPELTSWSPPEDEMVFTIEASDFEEDDVPDEVEEEPEPEVEEVVAPAPVEAPTGVTYVRMPNGALKPL